MHLASSVDGADRIRIEVLEALVGYHLRRASGVFVNDFARTLAGSGMRQVLFGILSIIAENPGINQGSVGRALGIQRANMVSLVTELADQGLVNRKPSAEDRRALSLSLTARGKKAVAECLAQIRAHEDNLLSDFSDDERAKLVSLLSRIEAKERPE